MNKIVAVLALLILVLVGGYYVSQPPENPAPSNKNTSGQQTSDGTLVGHRARDFTLKNLEGKEVTLSQLQGKTVMLNFWATWCPPCQEEMPAIQKYYTDKKPEDVEILAVNIMTNGDTEPVVQDFLAKNGYTFPVLLDRTEGRPVSREYGVYAIPTTYFIDKTGVIRDIHKGALTLEMIESKIEAARK